MRRFASSVGILAIVVVGGTGSAQAQEKPVPLDRIPTEIVDALLSRFPNARIDKCTRTSEGGAIVYDIELHQKNGRRAEADIKEGGVYVNYEQEIDASDLPRAVRDAIDKKYPKSILKENMQETEVKGKSERLSAYEIVLETAGHKRVEVRVSPEGKILEEGDAEKPQELTAFARGLE